MRDRYTFVPMVKISPGFVLQYTILDPRPVKSKLEKLASRERLAHAKSQKKAAGLDTCLYTGVLTDSARKRLIKSINLLIAISLPKKAIHFDSKKEFTFRINFITLTLPSPQGTVTDKQLKQTCLKQWLEYWKDQLPGMSYVWRAERQLNGNLHFHLITDRYIHYKRIQETWNRCLTPLGFIDAFEKANGHRQPNSTDVHAVKAIRNLAAYIAKYMSKKEKEGQKVEGKLWDCSRNLKAKDVCAFPASGADLETFANIYNELPNNAFSTEWCGGIRMSVEEMKKHFPESWANEFRQYLTRIREG